MKRILSIFIAFAMVAVTPLTAFAKEWYLDNGDIKITANEDGQYVTQGDVTEKDDDITITQNSDEKTENTISVETEDDVTAKFTLKDVNISVEDDESVIDIGDSDAEITVKGENKIEHETDEGSNATIHVESGSLTLKGDGTLDIAADSDGGKIGSNCAEDMSGTIHITDNVKIVTDDDGYLDGAAIGSGNYGDFTGEIIIDGNADVTAIANDDGAGIGTGVRGDFTGKITIGGEAKVFAKSDCYGAGIGTGDYGDFNGEIVIGGSSEVYAKSYDASGIGAGDDGTFSGGSIKIEGNANVTAIGDEAAPAIGVSDGGHLNGDIIIKGNSIVFVKGGYGFINESDYAPEIGSKNNCEDDEGSVYIIENAKVSLYDSDDKYLDIGSTCDDYFGGKIYIGSNAEIGGLTGSEILKDIDNAEDNGIYLNAESKNISLYNSSLIDIDDILDFIKENVEPVTPSVPTVGETASDEAEESNPNTGAPVILMDSHNVVFIPVAVTAKKRED